MKKTLLSDNSPASLLVVVIQINPFDPWPVPYSGYEICIQQITTMPPSCRCGSASKGVVLLSPRSQVRFLAALIRAQESLEPPGTYNYVPMQRTCAGHVPYQSSWREGRSTHKI